MSIFDISNSGKFLIVGGEKAPKKDIVIEMMDYGDGYFDIHFLNTKTDSLFGGSSLCGIEGRTRANQRLKELSEKATRPTKVTKIDDDCFY